MVVQQLVAKRLAPEVMEEVYEALCETTPEDDDLEERYLLAQGWCQDEIAERNWKAPWTEEEIEAGMKFDDKTATMLKENETGDWKKAMVSEMHTLEGMLRYSLTGVPIKHQKALPRPKEDLRKKKQENGANHMNRTR